MTLTINTPNKTYPIYIEELKKITYDAKVAIITNPTVSGLHIHTLMQKIDAKEIHLITLPDGEKYKNMQSIEFALDRMFDAKCDRNSVIIAFGGGVIGDMSGFCASIFLRGIRFVQVPTTLLSMVDSSVGGKTGINNSYGKNLIGAFYQPEAVYIDTHFLSTLPKREIAAGMAEVIKVAMMFDQPFFEKLKTKKLSYEEMIKRSVEIKADVVSQDEKERGIRSVLNYGHTFGHVIEKLTGFSTLLHGEAVAIGMVMANRLSVRLGFLSLQEAQEIEEVIKSYDLTTDFKVEDSEAFYGYFFADKKTLNNAIKFIIPPNIGEYKTVCDIPKETVIEVLDTFKGES